MATVQRESLIQASPEVVYAYVSDLTKHPEWAAHRLSIEKLSEGPVGVGTKYRTTGHQMGATLQDEVTVTEYEPPRRFVFESQTKAGRFRHTFVVTPEGDGARLTRSFEGVALSPLIKLLQPLILLTAPRAQAADMGRIKARIEQAATAS